MLHYILHAHTMLKRLMELKQYELILLIHLPIYRSRKKNGSLQLLPNNIDFHKYDFTS